MGTQQHEKVGRPINFFSSLRVLSNAAGYPLAVGWVGGECANHGSNFQMGLATLSLRKCKYS